MSKQIPERKYNYIYKITRFDGMFYIGRHATDRPKDSYFGSGTYISNSLRKYGKDKHAKEILEHLPDLKSLMAREREIVNVALLKDPQCMNMRIGGSGGDHDFVTREKIAEIAREVGQRTGVREIRSKNLANEWQNNREKRLAVIRTEEAKSNRSTAAKNRDGWVFNPLSAIKQQKPCTVDGITIFPSRKQLIAALGSGKNGTNSPTFRYV